MRIPGLHHLILLLRRSPVTEYERVMLLHRLHGRRHVIAMGALVLLAATSVAMSASTLPFVKRSSARLRSRCERPPWIASTNSSRRFS